LYILSAAACGGVTLHCQACPPFLSTASNPTCTSIASRGILCLSPLVQKLLNQTRQSSFEPMTSNPTTLSLDAELIRRIQHGSPPWSENSELRLKRE
jgi:hypothetical protein